MIKNCFIDGPDTLNWVQYLRIFYITYNSNNIENAYGNILIMSPVKIFKYSSWNKNIVLF